LVEELLVVTRLVAVALVVLRLMIVPEADTRSAISAVEIVVVARVVTPVTTKVLVVVASVTTSPSMNAVTAWNIDAKKLVDEALSRLAFAA
jgi:hypothetical protein